MTALSQALQGERWEVAAYCLLMGLLRTTLQIPDNAIPALLATLEGNGDEEGE